MKTVVLRIGGIWTIGGIMLTGQTQALGAVAVPLILCPSCILHRLVGDTTRDSVVRRPEVNRMSHGTFMAYFAERQTLYI